MITDEPDLSTMPPMPTSASLSLASAGDVRPRQVQSTVETRPKVTQATRVRRRVRGAQIARSCGFGASGLHTEGRENRGEGLVHNRAKAVQRRCIGFIWVKLAGEDGLGKRLGVDDHPSRKQMNLPKVRFQPGSGWRKAVGWTLDGFPPPWPLRPPHVAGAWELRTSTGCYPGMATNPHYLARSFQSQFLRDDFQQGLARWNRARLCAAISRGGHARGPRSRQQDAPARNRVPA
jgi:hypothetical protein